MFCIILSGMAAIPSCILWFLSCQLFFPFFSILGSTNYDGRVIYPRKMIYNLCEEMLITHVARPLSLLSPC